MQNIILTQLGLTENQITIYEDLLHNGAQKAGTLAKKSLLKRGLVYKILDDLVEMQLITKFEAIGSVAIFEPLHPSALKSLAESKMRSAKNTYNQLETEIGSLVSMYNLANNKPGIEFYEGVEGVKKVINDNLTSKTIVYTYADMEEVNKYIKDINAAYAKKRDRLKLQKKILLVDSEHTTKLLENYHKTHIEIRFVPKASHFSTIMQIYDNKISYVTLLPNRMIGVIVTDGAIYDMHKTLFERMWENAHS